MMDLDIGGIQAVVVDEVVGKFYLTKHPGQYKILTENFGDEQYGIGFRKDDKDLRDAVQTALNEMVADGTFKTISEKWLGK